MAGLDHLDKWTNVLTEKSGLNEGCLRHEGWGHEAYYTVWGTCQFLLMNWSSMVVDSWQNNPCQCVPKGWEPLKKHNGMGWLARTGRKEGPSSSLRCFQWCYHRDELSTRIALLFSASLYARSTWGKARIIGEDTKVVNTKLSKICFCQPGQIKFFSHTTFTRNFSLAYSNLHPRRS